MGALSHSSNPVDHKASLLPLPLPNSFFVSQLAQSQRKDSEEDSRKISTIDRGAGQEAEGEECLMDSMADVPQADASQAEAPQLEGAPPGKKPRREAEELL